MARYKPLYLEEPGVILTVVIELFNSVQHCDSLKVFIHAATANKISLVFRFFIDF